MNNNEYNFLWLFLCLLTLMFVYFKITGEITWSWLVVFLPLWAPLVLFLSILAIIFVVSFLVAALKNTKSNK